MSDHRPRPSRAVLWLLRRVSSRDAAEAAVGDILEALDERRAAGRAPRWTAFWLNRQVLASVAAEATAAVPPLLRSFGHTLRDAARALRCKPAQALFIVAILAAGIAAATVTFSVVDAVVLKPLPFDHGEELVFVSAQNARGFAFLNDEEFWAMHDRVAGFESLAAMTSRTSHVTAGNASEDLRVSYSMAELFRVLRLAPAIGRVWTEDEEARGDTNVAVIGYGLWQRRYGGDPDVLGRVLRIQDAPYRIVGVLAAAADFSGIGWPMEVWVPKVPSRTTDPSHVSSISGKLGRVRADVPLQQLAAQIQNAVAPLAARNPSRYDGWRPDVTRWSDSLVGDVRGWMLLVLAAVGLVVLIACVNAANVMLTRSAERSHELAIRASLGASRRALAISLLTESLMLSVGASACGLLFAVWGVRVARVAVATLPVAIFHYRAATIGLNGHVLTAAMCAALVTGVLFGTVPAWQASRASVVSLLKDSATTATSGPRTWRSVFLISEVACMCVLLVVSTLFIASFIRVATIDLGFARSNLLAVSTLTHFEGTVDDVKVRLGQIPGVTGVAAVNYSSPPLVSAAFSGAWGGPQLQPVDSGADAATIHVDLYRVTPDYFDVARIPFRLGSTWSPATPAGARLLVIDELAAQRLFGDRSPLGLQVRSDESNHDVYTIVGVVQHVLTHGPEGDSQPSAYSALAADGKPTWVSFLLRTSPPPAGLVHAVEASLASLTASGQPPSVNVVEDAFRILTATRRFNAGLMSAFALFAMLIGAAGIYAVMASVVSQQTREIGVRVALGATAGDIHRRVLTQAARHLMFGLVVGLPAAWWISRGFGALFFHVRPTDLYIYIIVSAVLAAVGLIAAAVPARRASRVDPVISLRAS